jgi:serine/threonine protein kinase
MTEDSDNSDMKLLDFGLSKIIGPSETCTEPFGTISYVAPEVLQEKPYDQKSDLWSVGIITYLLLCGCLPFDDEHDEKEIARQTIQDPVPYYPVLWKHLSAEAKDFVDRLLQKDPKKRMNVKEAINHCWIKNEKKKEENNNNNNNELIIEEFVKKRRKNSN